MGRRGDAVRDVPRAAPHARSHATGVPSAEREGRLPRPLASTASTCLPDSGRPRGGEALSCLHLSDDGDVEHLFTCPLAIWRNVFGEMSARVLGPFFNSVVYLSIVELQVFFSTLVFTASPWR